MSVISVCLYCVLTISADVWIDIMKRYLSIPHVFSLLCAVAVCCSFLYLLTHRISLESYIHTNAIEYDGKMMFRPTGPIWVCVLCMLVTTILRIRLSASLKYQMALQAYNSIHQQDYDKHCYKVDLPAYHTYIRIA